MAIPKFKVIFGGGDSFREPLTIAVEQFIDPKGIKAKGKRITIFTVDKIEELKPLKTEEPVSEPQEVVENEEIENTEDDVKVSQTDILDEMTGQQKLF